MIYTGTHAIKGALHQNLRFSIERDLVRLAAVATLCARPWRTTRRRRATRAA
jgi:hypothetical protein